MILRLDSRRIFEVSMLVEVSMLGRIIQACRFCSSLMGPMYEGSLARFIANVSAGASVGSFLPRKQWIYADFDENLLYISSMLHLGFKIESIWGEWSKLENELASSWVLTDIGDFKNRPFLNEGFHIVRVATKFSRKVNRIRTKRQIHTKGYVQYAWKGHSLV